MKQTKRILSILLAVLLIAVSVPTVFAASLNYTAKSLYYGKSVTLQVKGGTASSWTSSNTAVATVNSKGVVKGVGIGSATINATVGSQTLSCKVKVKDRNVDATVTFSTSTGGAFIYKVNTAVIKVKPQTYNVGKATVYVVDASGKGYYKTTLTRLVKDKTVSLTWDGKDTKGKVVPNGTYNVLVKIGSASSTSNMLAFVKKNYFAGGDGSKKNPFQVASIAQLKQIIRYPNACFKQTKNLDLDYESIGGFFTEDQPFNGVYDGNGKSISNVTATEALFYIISEKGQVKNLKLNRYSAVSTTDHIAALCYINNGKITNCSVSGAVSHSSGAGYSIYVGMIVATNNGSVSNCSSDGNAYCKSGSRNFNYVPPYCGGIVGYNSGKGKIINCSSKANVDSAGVYYTEACSGGIVGLNDGLVTDCEASGKITGKGHDRTAYLGGIAGTNNSQVIRCAYVGESDVNLVGTGTGIVA